MGCSLRIWLECGRVRLFGFAVASEHFFNFVDIELFHQVASRTAIFAWVEFCGLFSEHFAHCCGECQTRVAVDVDFANSALCSLAELFFRNTYGIGQRTAVGVDDVDIFLRH